MPSLSAEESALKGTNHKNNLRTIAKNQKEREKREKRKEEKKLKKLNKAKSVQDEVLNYSIGKVARLYKNSCLVLVNNQYITVPLTSNISVCVGDNVLVDSENSIQNILPRTNVFLKKAITGNGKDESQTMAVNLDYVAVYLPCKNPDIDFTMLDNILFSCFCNNIKTIFILNKCDLISESEKENIINKISSYSSNIEKFFFISAKNNINIEELSEFLKNKTTMLTGISGAGKSTFTNLLCPDINLETKEVDEKSGRGKHTTTFSTLIQLKNGGYIIDTPGIQAFNIYKGNPENLPLYLKDIGLYSQNCKFSNCSHITEDSSICGVKKALSQNKELELSYNRYLNLIRNCR